jgi:hypothetical protein
MHNCLKSLSLETISDFSELFLINAAITSSPSALSALIAFIPKCSLRELDK